MEENILRIQLLKEPLKVEDAQIDILIIVYPYHLCKCIITVSYMCFSITLGVLRSCPYSELQLWFYPHFCFVHFIILPLLFELEDSVYPYS